MRHKKALTLVNEALLAMSRGGRSLSRAQLLELQMAFATLKPEQLAYAAIELNDHELDPETWTKAELRRLKGNAVDFMPYLIERLNQGTHDVVFSKAERATLKATLARAVDTFPVDEVLSRVQAAFEAYRADYDTSYKLKTA